MKLLDYDSDSFKDPDNALDVRNYIRYSVGLMHSKDVWCSAVIAIMTALCGIGEIGSEFSWSRLGMKIGIVYVTAAWMSFYATAIAFSRESAKRARAAGHV